jgi:hypothetical protein
VSPGDGDDCAANTFGRRDRSSSGESGAGRDGKREKAIRIGSLAIEDCRSYKWAADAASRVKERKTA